MGEAESHREMRAEGWHTKLVKFRSGKGNRPRQEDMDKPAIKLVLGCEVAEKWSLIFISTPTKNPFLSHKGLSPNFTDKLVDKR